MDEEMDDNCVEYTFTAIEVDLDYEFDAARYFDFCREESLAESREAEHWFLTAPSYSASPFVAKLIPEGVLLQNVNTSPKPKHDENVNMLETNSDIEADEEVAVWNEDTEGKEEQKRRISANLHDKNISKSKSQTKFLPSGTSYKPLMKDRLISTNKSNKKLYGSKTSTLMKPTASLLAKQNQPSQISDRSQKVLGGKVEKSSSNSCVVEVQAAKRQKLEGGHLYKVGETKQQLNFAHKLPKKDANADGSSVQAKLRITIPREPALETAHRAQRMKPKIGGETEHSISTVRRFRALPLNRKIFDAPSLSLPKRSTPRVPTFQEFHLKTSERAIQHGSAISSGPVSCSNHSKELQTSSTSAATGTEAESRRSTAPDTSKLEGSEMSYRFRALPLNKKILSSKGDIGVFRNNKRDITVPMEFNFLTDRRVPYNPPTDLFNKLSLNSGTQSNTGMKLNLPPQTTCSPLKGSKENRWDSFRYGNEVKPVAKWKLPWSGGNHVRFGSNNGRFTDVLV